MTLFDQETGEVMQELVIPDQYTKTSLLLSDGLNYEQWAAIGKQIQKAADASMWWLGDWWRYGENKYGERSAAALDSSYEFQTLADAGWVSRKVSTSDRSEVLSWTHHRQVAALDPEDQREVLADAANNGWTVRETRKAARQIKAQRNLTHSPEFPEGKFRVVYADPPWSYGNEMTHYATTPEDHYQGMALEEICALDVASKCEDDAVLFLWCTSPHLPEAFPVIEAWGFEYKASFVWDKIKHNMGHYNSVRHEFLLIAVRGSCMPDELKLFDSVQSIERTKHSKKPEEFREIIDTIYPIGRRLELFARQQTGKWEVYGNQVGAAA